jgi:hypothetical protein
MIQLRKERHDLAHGASRGLTEVPPSPLPSPARAGEGRRRRGEGDPIYHPGLGSCEKIGNAVRRGRL